MAKKSKSKSGLTKKAFADLAHDYLKATREVESLQDELKELQKSYDNCKEMRLKMLRENGILRKEKRELLLRFEEYRQGVQDATGEAQPPVVVEDVADNPQTEWAYTTQPPAAPPRGFAYYLKVYEGDMEEQSPNAAGWEDDGYPD